MWFADSDNAHGSRRGDVDDAFALAALLLCDTPPIAVGSVAGNTSEEDAYRNNVALARVCGFQGPTLRTNEVPPFLASRPQSHRFLALGPLTNLAAALHGNAGLPVDEALIVGANLSSSGRWPPLWPHEFNLTADSSALLAVWNSGIALTFLPLDVARRMRVSSREVDELAGPVGEHLRAGGARWFTRARILKWTSSVPLYDLPAAMYAIDPAGFDVAVADANLHENGWIDFRGGARKVRIIRSFDRDALWRAFVSLVARRPSQAKAPEPPSEEPARG
jgi:inosine-uridine nucleoside N-ribohydrolase